MKKIKNLILQLYDVYCREFHLVMHDLGLIIFFTFLPLVYPIVYSLIYNPEVVRDVKMIVVDHDRTQKSREMVRKIDACQEAWVTGYAADLDEARRAMDSKECFAILEIPEGFQRHTGRGEQAKAVMYCDMSLLLRYRGFLVAATNVMQDMSNEITIDRIDEIAPLVSTISNGDLMPVENVTLGNIEGGFDSFIMPGVLILILHQCIILAVGMAGGAKREKRNVVGYNPVNAEPSVLMTMLGQMLCYGTILVIPMIFLIHYVPLIFAFPMAGNVLQEFAFLLPMVIACLGLGFMVQGIVTERENIFVIWVITSVVFLFLSGLTWPTYAMPKFWKALADIIPATWGVEGFIRMNTNGASLAQAGTAYRNLWILAGVYMAGAYIVQRWVVRPAIRRSRTPKSA